MFPTVPEKTKIIDTKGPGKVQHVNQIEHTSCTYHQVTQNETVRYPVVEARSENFPSIFGADKPGLPFSMIKPRISPECFDPDFEYALALKK